MTEHFIPSAEAVSEYLQQRSERYVALVEDAQRLFDPYYVKAPANPRVKPALALIPEEQNVIERNVGHAFAVTRVFMKYQLPRSMDLLAQISGSPQEGETTHSSGLIVNGELAREEYRESTDLLCAGIGDGLQQRHRMMADVVRYAADTISCFDLNSPAEPKESSKMAMPSDRSITPEEKKRNREIIEVVSKKNPTDGETLSLLGKINAQLNRQRGEKGTEGWDENWLDPIDRAALLHAYAEVTRKVLVYQGQIDECRVNRIAEAAHRQMMPNVDFAILDKEHPVYIARPPRPRIILPGLDGSERLVGTQRQVNL